MKAEYRKHEGRLDYASNKRRKTLRSGSAFSAFNRFRFVPLLVVVGWFCENNTVIAKDNMVREVPVVFPTEIEGVCSRLVRVFPFREKIKLGIGILGIQVVDLFLSQNWCVKTPAHGVFLMWWDRKLQGFFVPLVSQIFFGNEGCKNRGYVLKNDSAFRGSIFDYELENRGRAWSQRIQRALFGRDVGLFCLKNRVWLMRVAVCEEAKHNYHRKSETERPQYNAFPVSLFLRSLSETIGEPGQASRNTDPRYELIGRIEQKGAEINLRANHVALIAFLILLLGFAIGVLLSAALLTSSSTSPKPDRDYHHALPQ
jgi:hypothetical protein